MYQVFIPFWPADNAYACDPRVRRYKEKEKEEKLAQKRAKEEAARQEALRREEVVGLYFLCWGMVYVRAVISQERRLEQEKERAAQEKKEQEVWGVEGLSSWVM